MCRGRHATSQSRGGSRGGAGGDLQALLNDIQQDEEAEDVHASHGNGPQQVRPEETMLGAHSVVVATCTHNTHSCW